MASKIFVGNLNFNTTREELETLMAQVGAVKDVFLPTDRETGRPRGFGFVEMADGGAKAIAGLNGKDFGGRALNVNEAQPREASGGGQRSYGGPRGYDSRR